MAETTANQPIETYDGNASSALSNSHSARSAAHGNRDVQLTYHLEIVLIKGREGEKLQAIQARAIREALLWAAQHKEDSDNPEESGNE